MSETEPSFPYLAIVLAFIIVVYLFHTVLDLRQYSAIRRPYLPPSLSAHFSQDAFQKSRAYAIDKWWYGILHALYSLLQTCTVLYFKWLPPLWGWSMFVTSHLAHIFHGEITCTIIYIGILSFALYILDIPWSLYQTFVLEQRHGFNKQTLALYISDTITGFGVALVLLPPIVGGMTWILMRSDHWLPMYLCVFFLCVSIFMMTVYPIAIAPLFNKFEALKEGALRTKIEDLASQLKFPLTRVYQMDGSKRSAHSNAYMYGLFKNKRIVLFDTLIKDCTEDEVIAVLAHEIGHWKMSHNLYNFVINQMVVLCQFLLFSLIRKSADLYQSFGFVEDRPVFISFILFSLLSTPLSEVIGLFHNVISRRFEFQADAFAVQLGHGNLLRTALITLQKTNKSSLNVDPWYSTYHYSHPPLAERLEAIDNILDKKQ